MKSPSHRSPWIENLALNKQKVMKALELFGQLARGVDAKTDGNVFSSSGKKHFQEFKRALDQFHVLMLLRCSNCIWIFKYQKQRQVTKTMAMQNYIWF